MSDRFAARPPVFLFGFSSVPNLPMRARKSGPQAEAFSAAVAWATGDLFSGISSPSYLTTTLTTINLALICLSITPNLFFDGLLILSLSLS